MLRAILGEVAERVAVIEKAGAPDDNDAYFTLLSVGEATAMRLQTLT